LAAIDCASRQPDRQRDQPLLGTVMDVAFEPAAGLVLRRNQTLLRGAQLLQARLQLAVQPHVAKDEAGLGREVGDQLWPWARRSDRRAAS
jgi:hypothetical protein